MTTTATAKSRLLTALRLVPAALLLAGVLHGTPSVGATGCHTPASQILVNGGTSRNTTTLTATANGGQALSNAKGGDDNLAIGLLGQANAGTGGTADAKANGGTITLGDITSGNNTGNVLQVGTPKLVCGTSSRLVVNGGTARTETTVTLSAKGGTATANANGGDDNLAVGLLGTAAAGTGSSAKSQANGGSIAVGDITSGGNTGNVIAVGGGSGSLDVTGGTSSNETNIDLNANGGTATANANGGDDNTAVGIGGNAAAGNGGTASSQANGGTIEVGDINSGGNVGNVIEVGPSGGPVNVDGGTSSNETTIDLSANGGTAEANANGGDDNVAVGLGGNAEAGNGGTASSQANGGSIEVGDINSGNNTGNVITVGN